MATPVPIPNTVVKRSSADGTARETVWESRTPPGINLRTPRADGPGRFAFFDADFGPPFGRRDDRRSDVRRPDVGRPDVRWLEVRRLEVSSA